MIGIIIPTYNEKDNIFKLTKTLIKLIQIVISLLLMIQKNNLRDYFKNKRKISYIYRVNKKGRDQSY